MSTYALIDNYSGFVWGVADAESPVEAAKSIDEDVDPSAAASRQYEEVCWASSSNETGYFVHAAPSGFTVDDGQDEREIANVSALPCLCFVRITTKEDDHDRDDG